MSSAPQDAFQDRLKTAAAARLALLAKLQPRPAIRAEQPIDRDQERRAALVQVRAERAQAREVRRQLASDALAADAQAQADREAAELAAKRGQRKERKALSAAEAKARRDARYAARQARR